MAAMATRKIVASEVKPPTPSIGTGNASDTAAAASKTATPTRSSQLYDPETSEEIAKPRPTAPPTETGSHTGSAFRELGSSWTRGRRSPLSEAPVRTGRWLLRLTVRFRAGRTAG